MPGPIGFIGVGQMGQPMAHNLLKSGFELRVYDKHPEQAAPLVALGAHQAFRLSDVAAPGGIVITMVPDDQALEEVVLSEGGILAQLGANGIHLSMSTVSPQSAERFAALYATHGSCYLAATVLGRPDVAAAAHLSIFLAGPRAAQERVLPLLQALGKDIYDVGEAAAAANVVKIAANFLIVAAIEAMGEAAALVECYGLNRAQFLHMMVASPLFGGAVYEGYGRMIGENHYEEALFPVPLGLKDVDLVLSTASAVHVPVPLASIAREHLLRAIAEGWAAQDWSVLARAIAKEARLQADTHA
jgi:3-hydroxyisobutyrate dehydrogenase-like beta-hydroxyacid dehydrogenase